MRLLYVAAATLALAAPAAALASHRDSQQPDAGYCAHGAYGYNVFVSGGSFRRGGEVNFCLQDDTRSPLFIGAGQHPWKIVDAGGNTVFAPASQAPDSQPPMSYTFYDRWNGRDAKGRPVKPGEYSVVFDYPGNPSASFEIGGRLGRPREIWR